MYLKPTFYDAEPDPRTESIAWAQWYRRTQDQLAPLTEVGEAWRTRKQEWAQMERATA